MLATTNVLIKTEDGREALAQRRHDMQMRQRHLLILIDGARTVGQLHQLLVIYKLSLVYYRLQTNVIYWSSCIKEFRT